MLCTSTGRLGASVAEVDGERQPKVEYLFEYLCPSCSNCWVERWVAYPQACLATPLAPAGNRSGRDVSGTVHQSDCVVDLSVGLAGRAFEPAAPLGQFERARRSIRPQLLHSIAAVLIDSMPGNAQRLSDLRWPEITQEQTHDRGLPIRQESKGIAEIPGGLAVGFVERRIRLDLRADPRAPCPRCSLDSRRQPLQVARPALAGLRRIDASGQILDDHAPASEEFRDH